MSTFLYKLLGYPFVLAAVDWLLPEMRFGSLLQLAIVGVGLAALAQLADIFLLRRFGVFWMAVFDGLGSLLALNLLPYVFVPARISFGSALITAVLLAALEYVLHFTALLHPETGQRN